MKIILLLAAALTLTACSSGSPRKPSERDNAAAYNVQLGIAYLQQGNLPVAKEKLERAAQQNPRDPDVHGALALLYERLGESNQADAHHRTALRLAPRNPDISNNYAIYLCRTGRSEEGVKRFLAAAKNPLYRTPEAAYTNAGVCLRSAKQPADKEAAQAHEPPRVTEAERYFLRALEIRPNFAEASFQLGNLYLEGGNAEKARTQVDRYLSAFNATPELLLLGVRSAQALGDRAGAERYARRLRVDFPGSEQTRALPELLRKTG